MRHRTLTVLAVAGLALAGAIPDDAAAQGFGLGPRFSFVKGQAATGTPAVRFLGGTMRLSNSRRTAIELAMDYRATRNEENTERLRERPVQASLLIFLVRGRVSPYLLGGFGMYSRMTDTLGPQGQVLSTESERRTGWHMGLGGEIFLARHAALFADYRFRFVRFGDPEDGAEQIDVPGLDRLKLSHQGSMWTSGVAFYF